MVTNLIVVIISQYIHVSNHEPYNLNLHNVTCQLYFSQYVSLIYLIYISIYINKAMWVGRKHLDGLLLSYARLLLSCCVLRSVEGAGINRNWKIVMNDKYRHCWITEKIEGKNIGEKVK